LREGLRSREPEWLRLRGLSRACAIETFSSNQPLATAAVAVDEVSLYIGLDVTSSSKPEAYVQRIRKSRKDGASLLPLVMGKGAVARLVLEDLNFYSEWLGNLTQRFHAFQQLYIQQQQNVNRALNGARAFQEQFVTTYQPREQFTDYWTSYGSYRTLQALLEEGCIQAEYLLPLMQSQLSEMDSILAKHRPTLPR